MTERTSPDLTGAGASANDDLLLHVPLWSAFEFFWDPDEKLFGYRGRPPWTTEAEMLWPGTANHRRHILPSHLLLDALCRAANSHSRADLESHLLGFATHYCLEIPDTHDTCTLLEVVARFIVSNPRNLWPGAGPENTAIGFLRAGVLMVKETMLSERRMGIPTNRVIANVVESLWRLGQSGMHKAVRAMKVREILEFVQSTGPEADQAVRSKLRLGRRRGGPDSVLSDVGDAIARIEEVLSFAAANLELDLNGTEGMQGFRLQNPIAIALFERLHRYTYGAPGAPGGGAAIWQILHEFMTLPLDAALPFVSRPRPAMGGGIKRWRDDGDDPKDKNYEGEPAKKKRKKGP